MAKKKKPLPPQPALTLELLRSGEATLTSHSIQETYDVLWPHLHQPLGQHLLAATQALTERSDDGRFLLSEYGARPSLFYILREVIGQVLHDLKISGFEDSEDDDDEFEDNEELDEFCGGLLAPYGPCDWLGILTLHTPSDACRMRGASFGLRFCTLSDGSILLVSQDDEWREFDVAGVSASSPQTAEEYLNLCRVFVEKHAPDIDAFTQAAFASSSFDTFTREDLLQFLRPAGSSFLWGEDFKAPKEWQKRYDSLDEQYEEGESREEAEQELLQEARNLYLDERIGYLKTLDGWAPPPAL